MFDITLFTYGLVRLLENNPNFYFVPQYGTTWSMAVSLSQSLAQNLGIQWDPASKRSMHSNTYY